MSNRRKISTEKLKEIIVDYIANNKYVAKLKYTELVKHSILMGYNNINSQDFIRNIEIKNIVDEFNQKNKMSDYLKKNKDFKQLQYIKLDIESIIDNNTNKVTQKALLNIYKDNYNRAFEELKRLNNENNELKNTIVSLTEEVKEIKKKNQAYKVEIESKKDEIKLQEKIDKEHRCLNAIEYLIDRNLAYKLTKEDIKELMKYLFKDNYNDIIEIDNTNIDDSDEEVVDENTFESNIVELKLPNIF